MGEKRTLVISSPSYLISSLPPSLSPSLTCPEGRGNFFDHFYGLANGQIKVREMTPPASESVGKNVEIIFGVLLEGKQWQQYQRQQQPKRKKRRH